MLYTEKNNSNLYFFYEDNLYEENMNYKYLILLHLLQKPEINMACTFLQPSTFPGIFYLTFTAEEAATAQLWDKKNCLLCNLYIPVRRGEFVVYAI